MKISSRLIVHQVAHCYVCEKEWQDYRGQNARKQAYDHARKTGHKVVVETGTAVTYN